MFFLKISSYIKSPWEGGVHVICSKLKLIKYISTEQKDDILEELDL
jgi:hypothetical protein